MDKLTTFLITKETTIIFVVLGSIMLGVPCAMIFNNPKIMLFSIIPLFLLAFGIWITEIPHIIEAIKDEWK